MAQAFACSVLAAFLLAATGCDGGTARHSAQPLRTCIDRWNQANMVGWGPALVSISIRRLGGTELAAAGLQNPARRRCVISFAFESRADAQTGCPENGAVPGRAGWCVDRTGTFACATNTLGAYSCPLIHEPLGPPLMNRNAMTNERGVLKLDAPLTGTHPTPRLAWQRRYPHTTAGSNPGRERANFEQGSGSLPSGMARASSGQRGHTRNLQ